MSVLVTSPPSLCAEALADLRDDFDELLFLVRSASAKLAATEQRLDDARCELHEATAETLLAQVRGARSRYGAAGRRLLALHALAGRDREAGEDELAELAAEKAAFADLLRSEQLVSAALAAAADWQSPSFLHAARPAAGTQTGRIEPHWNDYKRDRHLDADAYERAYLEELVDGPADLRVLVTSCGMAAFTTILFFLLTRRRLDGPVVIGRALYHESKQLLEQALSGRVHAVDERDTGALVDAIDRLRPGAVFLDSLCNTRWMPVPDLASVAGCLRGTETYLVVDNTGLSVGGQPFTLGADRLIVFESLLKYAQLGLDRVNAGAIVCSAEDADGLDDCREHLGTNISDVAVNALPRPARWVLERRLARLQRNAAVLAREVGDAAHAVYPGLGGCLSLVLPDRRRERAFVERAIEEARRRGVGLIGGSSFGFDTTRVYLTAARTDHGEPFVRIAAGTEHRLEIERVAETLVAAVHA